MRTDTQKALCKLLKGDYRNESSLELVRRVEGLVSALRRERDGLRESLGDVENLLSNNGLLHEDLLTSIHKLLARPDESQPQLSEIRYVLHGDIQPCSVLYSDDTTTLLRLDEGDIMCETDTIEWSDSVTYRCQELLKSGGVGRPVDILAQLVRDERILLCDFAGDELPVCPPHVPNNIGNEYKHTCADFTEQSMRDFGWTTTALVHEGYGHYIPAQVFSTAEDLLDELGDARDAEAQIAVGTVKRPQER